MRVFISYSSRDEEFVLRLAADLGSREEIDVWLDKWEIRPGDRVPEKLEEGLSKADVLILVLSPDSVNSRWVDYERQAWLALQIKEEKQASQESRPPARRLIPVLYRDCQKPAFLLPIQHVRITDQKYQDGFGQLVRTILRVSEKPPTTGEVKPSVVAARRIPQRKYVLTLLKSLLPSQFSEVTFMYKMTYAYLPSNASQIEKAIALIQYATQQEGENLPRLLNTIYAVAPHLIEFKEIEEHLKTARDYLSTKDYQRAMAESEAVLSVDPEEKEAQRIKEDASRIQEKVVRLKKKIVSFLAKDNFLSASSAVRDALAIAPKDRELTQHKNTIAKNLTRLAEEFQDGHRLYQTKEYLERIVSLDEDNIEARRSLAQLEKNIRKAKLSLNKAKALLKERNYTEALRRLGEAFSINQDEREVEELSRSLREAEESLKNMELAGAIMVWRKLYESQRHDAAFQLFLSETIGKAEAVQDLLKKAKQCEESKDYTSALNYWKHIQEIGLHPATMKRSEEAIKKIESTLIPERNKHWKRSIIPIGFICGIVLIVILTGLYFAEKNRAQKMELVKKIRVGSSQIIGTGYSPSWSKYDRIAFHSYRHGKAQIFIMDHDGSGLTQLTNRDEYSFYPKWSPDANRISYTSGSPGHYAIHIMDANGTSVERLTLVDYVSGCPSWWFDGSRLLFHTDRAGVYQVWSSEPDGSDQRILVSFISNAPECSPKTGEFLFSAKYKDTWNIWFAKLRSSDSIIDHSKARPLTTNSFVSGGASWSPKGNYIAFAARKPGEEGIWIMNRDGSGQRLLFREKRRFVATSWAPDGKSIIYSASDSLSQGEPTEGDIIVLSLEGASQ